MVHCEESNVCRTSKNISLFWLELSAVARLGLFSVEQGGIACCCIICQDQPLCTCNLLPQHNGSASHNKYDTVYVIHQYRHDLLRYISQTDARVRPSRYQSMAHNDLLFARNNSGQTHCNGINYLATVHAKSNMPSEVERWAFSKTHHVIISVEITGVSQTDISSRTKQNVLGFV